MRSAETMFDTVTLVTDDIATSQRFYRDALGLRELDDVSVGPLFDAGGARLQLFPSSGAHPGAVSDDALGKAYPIWHLCFTTGTIDALAERMHAAGATILIPPTDAPSGVRVSFLSGPDGVVLELSQGELIYDRTASDSIAAVSTPGTMETRLDHLAVQVDDRRVAADHLERMAGFHPVGELHLANQKVDILYLTDGTLRIELFEFEHGGPGAALDVSQRWRIGITGESGGHRILAQIGSDGAVTTSRLHHPQEDLLF